MSATNKPADEIQRTHFVPHVSEPAAPQEQAPSEKRSSTWRAVVQNMCEIEELIEAKASEVLTEYEVHGDSYGVPGIAGIVDTLVEKIKTMLPITPQRFDSEGCDITGLYGLHDPTDRVVMSGEHYDGLNAQAPVVDVWSHERDEYRKAIEGLKQECERQRNRANDNAWKAIQKLDKIAAERDKLADSWAVGNERCQTVSEQCSRLIVENNRLHDELATQQLRYEEALNKAELARSCELAAAQADVRALLASNQMSLRDYNELVNKYYGDEAKDGE